jgi:heme-binding NEAT domain protein
MVVTPGTVPLGQLTFNYQVSNSNLVSSILFNTNSFPVNGATVTAEIYPANNQAGTAAVTFTVSDGVSTVSQSFVLTVLATSTPPSLGPISNVTTPANTPVTVPMVVTAGTVPLTNLTFSYQVSNSNLVSSIVFNPTQFPVNGVTVNAQIIPGNNQAGTATVTFNVSDGTTTVSRSFQLTVGSPTGPTLSFVLVGKVLKITFTGVPNATYIIQASSNLASWTQIGPPITADASGKVEYDATVNSTGQEYIRVVLQ